MAWCRPHDWSLASANVGAQTPLSLHIRHSKDQWQSKINTIRESTVWKKNIRNRWPHPLLRIGFCVCVGAGVPILRYINISILIKYSNFSRFHKKNWVHFIKNSDVTSLVIDQSQPKMHWTIRYKALWKYICIWLGTAVCPLQILNLLKTPFCILKPQNELL